MPRGDTTSFYTSGSASQMRDSIRFTADLDLAGNTVLVKKYGTNRLPN